MRGNGPRECLRPSWCHWRWGAPRWPDDVSPGVVRVSDAPPPSSQVTPASAPAGSRLGPGSPAAAPVPGLAPDASCSVCDPNAALGYGRGGNCGGCDNCRRGLLGNCCLFQCCHCGWRFLDAHCYCMTYAVSPWYCDPAGRPGVFGLRMGGADDRAARADGDEPIQLRLGHPVGTIDADFASGPASRSPDRRCCPLLGEVTCRCLSLTP